MKEFIEKLYDKFEEKYRESENYHKYARVYRQAAFKEAVAIVSETAKEFATDINVVSNKGWIPCSERLPEGNKAVLVCTNAGQIDVDYYGEYIKDFIGLKGTEQYAIAWMPLPQPFKEEGVKE